MYIAEYETFERIDSNGGMQENCIMCVKFRFWNEVAPKHRDYLHERLKTSDNAYNLKKYLSEHEGLEYDLNLNSYCDENRTLFMNKRFRLGLDLTIKSGENQLIIPFNKMLDLNGLNNFILTGKMPEKKSG